MSQSAPLTYNIVLTGDVVVDHHIYHGERDSPPTEHRRGVRDWCELGGAVLLKETLERIFEQARGGAWSVHVGIRTPGLNDTPCGHHAYAIWQPAARTHGDEKNQVWRSPLVMGYGHTHGNATSHCREHTLQPLPGVPAADILVLDDAGSEFRLGAQRASWLLPESGAKQPAWVVLKMSRPVAQGDLWHALVERFADRLVCVITADALRHEAVAISRGLSWERTVEEMRDGLLHNPALAGLDRCRHLVVTFAADGALWLDRSRAGQPRATLCFDAGGAEGEWKSRADGTVMGQSAPFVASVVHALSRHLEPATGEEPDPEFNLAPAIEAGLAAARDLFDLGHGPVGEELPRGYPSARLAQVILDPRAAFARAAVPWPAASDAPAASGQPWSIVEESQRALGAAVKPSLTGLARQVVLQGDAVLKRLPHAVFGKLVTADRAEIETLRNLRRLILEYRDRRGATKPLSIGIFGPPGAGKSFGVRQIADDLLGKEAWREFNLSQFAGPADLIGAFHDVRDLVLSGRTPAIFWDEFDSREYEWLQYLLAPMQDGRFQDGPLNHAIGKCVFVFAGATSPTFGEFGPPPGRSGPEAEKARRDFRLRKGPDFQSRLDAYYDVAGPNRRTVPAAGENGERLPDPEDVCHPLRRALLIRGLLGCGTNEQMDFDSDLLDALLLVPSYRHGSRSLEKLVAPLWSAHRGPIRRSSLPAPAQLAMHVDPVAFASLLNRNLGFKMSRSIDALAKGIHEAWRTSSQNQSGRMQPNFDKPYAELAEIDKEDNRAAARRIPEILALAGMAVDLEANADTTAGPSEKEIREHLAHHMERLAEAEHDGWMNQRRRNGWSWGKTRDDARKVHPLLVPYTELSEKEKKKDRSAVSLFPDMVALAGYRIVWTKG